MKIHSFRLQGVRCFEDTGTVELSPGLNLFVGSNNAGKSTALRAVTGWQIWPFEHSADIRPGAPALIAELVLDQIAPSDFLRKRPPSEGPRVRYLRGTRNDAEAFSDLPTRFVGDESLFHTDWPNNFIVPFLAKRKASGFQENVNRSHQASMDGTFSHLYARIDRVVSPGTRAHELYRSSVEEIVGVFITTQSSDHGKIAGYYFDDDHFVTLDRMGDGVSEMVALIVELSLSANKVFVLEEPETNLHPRGLKALLSLVRKSSSQNQFIVATHSNVVVRELGAEEGSKIFRVYRDGETPSSPSLIEEIDRTPVSHLELLRELGYEFGDFNLHDAWLILEEASAESILSDILIPMFAPELAGRLRTYSARGIGNVSAAVSEFQRLIAFIHLQPVYQDRLWLRVDGDGIGHQVVDTICQTFPYLASPRACTFTKENFEEFYPARFDDRVREALEIADKRERQRAKNELRAEVIAWSAANQAAARTEWLSSAAEPIALLEDISAALRR